MNDAIRKGLGWAVGITIAIGLIAGWSEAADFWNSAITSLDTFLEGLQTP